MIIEGTRSGRLTVLGVLPGRTKLPRKCLCRCDCGELKILSAYDVGAGRIRSCGCLRRERHLASITKHGMTGAPEYFAWCAIIQRCKNPKAQNYHHYGGRGISICARWSTFENFFADMGNRPSPDHSIERKNNDGPYSPENCKWATQQEQCGNTQRSIRIKINGETKSLPNWCRHYHQRYGLVFDRIRRLGWEPEDALTTPAQPRKK